jgi:hypothetical protein
VENPTLERFSTFHHHIRFFDNKKNATKNKKHVIVTCTKHRLVSEKKKKNKPKTKRTKERKESIINRFKSVEIRHGQVSLLGTVARQRRMCNVV